MSRSIVVADRARELRWYCSSLKCKFPGPVCGLTKVVSNLLEEGGKLRPTLQPWPGRAYVALGQSLCGALSLSSSIPEFFRVVIRNLSDDTRTLASVVKGICDETSENTQKAYTAGFGGPDRRHSHSEKIEVTAR